MSNIVEEWREVPDFPGYEVSTFGRVRSWRKPGSRDERASEPTILTATHGRVSMNGRTGERYRMCGDRLAQRVFYG